ncbi:MAG: ribonuclease P protein component [Candidatus Eutrophobiaceae bacterium]
MYANERFGRQCRLTNPLAFRKVFIKGRRKTHREIVMVTLKTGTASLARLGFAVSKRQIRRAVDRNRIKRFARESFRQASDMPLGVDVVLMPRKACSDLDNKKLRATLDSLWRKL